MPQGFKDGAGKPMRRREFLRTTAIGCAASAFPRWLLAQSQNGLPNVLLLGDSISVGYTQFVQELLKGKANVKRPLRENGDPENCLGTTNGVSHIDRWLGDTRWDVIHFNFGLHDLKHVDPVTRRPSENPEHPQEADLTTYRKNLTEIVKKLVATEADLIFATTTPYPDKPDGPVRRADQPAKYNEVALKIMKQFGVMIDDLYSFALPRLTETQRPHNVHFTDEGSKGLAKQVAEKILMSIQG
ncbi:MAG: SGNH/GDSL hydrolase family protein [Luteitalea sp.]|nr:SGNH/GDSL hydrolase family protein [Luteitalea sp.]